MPHTRCTFACRSSRSRAFTIIELLVVIAIIALLVGILLPALAHARIAGQTVVSASNLSQWGRVNAIYAADNKGCMVNPFDPSTRLPNNLGWWCYIDKIGNQVSELNGETRATEAYAFLWGSHIAATLQGAYGDYVGGYLRDPRDPYINNRHKWFFSNAMKGGSTLSLAWVDTSYLLSPTVYTHPKRYVSDGFIPLSGFQLIQTGKQYMRRNRVDEVRFPSAKAFAFERFDWSQKSRVEGASLKRTKNAPQWNNPGAIPQVVFCDASVGKVHLSKLHELANSSDIKVRRVYKPSGFFGSESKDNIEMRTQWFENFSGEYLVHGAQNPNRVLESPISQDPWEIGRDKAWRQFLWATRNGIYGRDVPQR